MTRRAGARATLREYSLTMSTPLHIDGSYGEGGGQILRTSLSLAILTGRPVAIQRIRAGRKKPGLQPQHLTAVRAAAAVCAARVTGDRVGSTDLQFEPGAPAVPGRYRFDIGTAGATPLVLQTVLLPLARAVGSSHVTATGGTHVPHAPAAEYLEAVYLPALRLAGLEVDLEFPGYGFFPRGGGQLQATIRSTLSFTPVDFTERGRLTRLRAFVVTSGLPEHVAERGAATVEKFMKGIGRKGEVERRDKPSPGPGAAVLVAAECEGGLAGFTQIGERGVPMEKVAQAPCKAFLAWWKTGAAVDEHLSDQLVLPMSLAAGQSRWTTHEVTEHLRTVLWVAGQFLPIESELEEREGGGATVTLRGAG